MRKTKGQAESAPYIRRTHPSHTTAELRALPSRVRSRLPGCGSACKAPLSSSMLGTGDRAHHRSGRQTKKKNALTGNEPKVQRNRAACPATHPRAPARLR